MTQKWLKIDQIWRQNDAKMTQKWFQNDSKMTQKLQENLLKNH